MGQVRRMAKNKNETSEAEVNETKATIAAEDPLESPVVKVCSLLEVRGCATITCRRHLSSKSSKRYGDGYV